MEDYLKSQIITYMGNKRKLLPYIEEIVLDLEKEIIGYRNTLNFIQKRYELEDNVKKSFEIYQNAF